MELEKSFFKKPNLELEGNELIKDVSISDDVCTTCPECKKMLFLSQLKENMQVCMYCGCYMRVGARERIEQIADEGSFVELFADYTSKNPIDFPGYEEKLERAMKASGENEGVLTGVCSVNGKKTAIFVMDSKFISYADG